MLQQVSVADPTSKSQGAASAAAGSKNIRYPELQALDQRLTHIIKHKIQPSPYILTVPSDRPYNRDPRAFHDWRRGTPFDEDEEQLQYLSFLADWDDGLIRPVGGWDNVKGEIMDRSNSQQSNMSTTSVVGSTKKIKYSLADYKKKAAGQPFYPTPGEGEKALRVNGVESRSADTLSAMPEKKTLKRFAHNITWHIPEL